jgi:NADPH2:quinone reductase
MTHAIRMHETGGPEVLVWEEIEVGDPGPGQARIRHTAVGLNYIDTYHRSGLYPIGEMPAILGREAAAVVEALGPGVERPAVGNRVASVLGGGTYCEASIVDAERLIPLPDTIDDPTAAAMMLKGLTAQYLLRRTHEVRPGETILYHAAAGGVGLIACQWAKQLGATVIGTVGSEAKAELARQHGCDHTILYGEENFVERVREITDGRGVPVVYDSVGRDTFDGSLDCLRPLGHLISFGQSSGPVPPFNIGTLSLKGSLSLTRPTLATYIADREMLLASTKELFDVVGSGAVRVEVRQSYRLRDAERAHRDLEGRKTTGSTVLLV